MKKSITIIKKETVETPQEIELTSYFKTEYWGYEDYHKFIPGDEEKIITITQIGKNFHVSVQNIQNLAEKKITFIDKEEFTDKLQELQEFLKNVMHETE